MKMRNYNKLKALIVIQSNNNKYNNKAKIYNKHFKKVM